MQEGSGDLAPAILIAWSNTSPASRLVRVPLDGELVLGRAALGEDSRVSQNHARIAWAGDHFAVTDLDSRNGTWVNGQRISGTIPVMPTSTVRVGRTLGVLVRDARRYDTEAPERSEPWISGRLTAPLHARLLEAAAARSHVVIFGDPGIGRFHLARSYAAMLAPLRVRLEEEPLLRRDNLIEFLDSIASTDDVRVVFTQNRFASPFPQLLEDFVTHHAVRIELPNLRERADEVARIIRDTVARVAPARTCHADLLEHVLTTPTNLSVIVSGVRDAARVPLIDSMRAQDFIAAVQRNWVLMGR